MIVCIKLGPKAHYWRHQIGYAMQTHNYTHSIHNSTKGKGRMLIIRNDVIKKIRKLRKLRKMKT